MSNICKGCNSSLCITTLDTASKYPKISILPGSNHIFGYNSDFYHLNKKCIENLENIPEYIKSIINEIPSKSLTSFSKLEKKKEISLNCAICLENENKWLMMMPCMHILCVECYNIWKKKNLDEVRTSERIHEYVYTCCTLIHKAQLTSPADDNYGLWHLNG